VSAHAGSAIAHTLSDGEGRPLPLSASSFYRKGGANSLPTGKSKAGVAQPVSIDLANLQGGHVSLSTSLDNRKTSFPLRRSFSHESLLSSSSRMSVYDDARSIVSAPEPEWLKQAEADAKLLEPTDIQPAVALAHADGDDPVETKSDLHKKIDGFLTKFIEQKKLDEAKRAWLQFYNKNKVPVNIAGGALGGAAIYAMLRGTPKPHSAPAAQAA